MNRKLLRDRVTLIRSLERTVPVARANGDHEALSEIINRTRRDADGDQLSYSQDAPDLISYNPGPSRKRVKTTIGRYVRRRLKICPATLSDKGLMQITNALFAELMSSVLNMPVRIITGNDITEAYKIAVGDHSCMTGDCYPYVYMYALNPDKVAMVLFGKSVVPIQLLSTVNGCTCEHCEERRAINTETLKGNECDDDDPNRPFHTYATRALLWTCDDGSVVLDRVYPNDGRNVEALTLWAATKGYLYRAHQSHPVQSVPLSDGSARTVTLRHEGVFPFMDSFVFGTDLKHGFTRFSNHPPDMTHSYMSTTGERTVLWLCDYCEEPISNTSRTAADGSRICMDCYNDAFSSCDNCGDSYPNEEMQTNDELDQILCAACAEELTETCARCQAPANPDSVVIVGRDPQTWCRCCTQGVRSRIWRCENPYCATIYYTSATPRTPETGEYHCELCRA